jgi:hypothetical protein
MPDLKTVRTWKFRSPEPGRVELCIVVDGGEEVLLAINEKQGWGAAAELTKMIRDERWREPR